jgi:hypothetical protein
MDVALTIGKSGVLMTLTPAPFARGFAGSPTAAISKVFGRVVVTRD